LRERGGVSNASTKCVGTSYRENHHLMIASSRQWSKQRHQDITQDRLAIRTREKSQLLDDLLRDLNQRRALHIRPHRGKDGWLERVDLLLVCRVSREKADRSHDTTVTGGKQKPESALERVGK
jgi:hypothetical protein